MEGGRLCHECAGGGYRRTAGPSDAEGTALHGRGHHGHAMHLTQGGEFFIALGGEFAGSVPPFERLDRASRRQGTRTQPKFEEAPMVRTTGPHQRPPIMGSGQAFAGRRMFGEPHGHLSLLLLADRLLEALEVGPEGRDACLVDGPALPPLLPPATDHHQRRQRGEENRLPLLGDQIEDASHEDRHQHHHHGKALLWLPLGDIRRREFLPGVTRCQTG